MPVYRSENSRLQQTYYGGNSILHSFFPSSVDDEKYLRRVIHRSHYISLHARDLWQWLSQHTELFACECGNYFSGPAEFLPILDGEQYGEWFGSLR
jgi:hypothetical protein